MHQHLRQHHSALNLHDRHLSHQDQVESMKMDNVRRLKPQSGDLRARQASNEDRLTSPQLINRKSLLLRQGLSAEGSATTCNTIIAMNVAEELLIKLNVSRESHAHFPTDFQLTILQEYWTLQNWQMLNIGND